MDHSHHSNVGNNQQKMFWRGENIFFTSEQGKIGGLYYEQKSWDKGCRETVEVIAVALKF